MAALPFRSALVTGASSGIGLAIAERLAGSGVPVVAVARRRDRLAQLAGRCPDVEVLVADLTTVEGVDSVARRVADGSAPIDLLVNNAGFGSFGRFDSLDAERIAREVQLNVVALTRLSHAAITAMVPRARGYLLNVSSVAGFQPAVGLAVYAATKAYVTSLSQSLHDEVAEQGVRVTALCPGPTPTEFQQVSGTGGYQMRYPRWAWTSVDLVVRSGLRDVAAGKALSVPGVVYKAMAAGSRVAPRRLVSALSRRARSG